MESSIINIIAGIIAIASPLILAALGETITEKGGIINLSLDGTILLSAMTGFTVALQTDSLFTGFAAAALTGVVVAAVLALIAIWLQQSQVAVGFALTFLCRDLAYFLGNPYAKQKGLQLTTLPLPYLDSIPVLGPIFFSHTIIVYGSMVAIPMAWYFLYHTNQGLTLRLVGENPNACWARGIKPRIVQTMYTLVGGALIGLAGAAFSLAIKPGWGRPQGCEGIGWIALALVIFGSWHPLRVAAGAYLFGFLQILGIYLQDFFPTIPSQVFQTAPFPLMIFTLILIHLGKDTTGKKRLRLLRLLSGNPPQALGKSYHPS